METDPEISVVVPTYNRALSLLETLKALSIQTLKPQQYEVIVVDDGSTDNTSGIVSKFKDDHPSLQLQYKRHDTNRFKSAACNTGIKVASGALLAFTDDDIRPVPGWLEAHLKRHKLEVRPVAVIGSVLYPKTWEEESNWVRFANENYRRTEMVSNSRSGTLPPTRFAGGNVSLPQKTLVSAGMYNEKMRRGVDGDLGCRLHLMGLPLVFEKRAVVYHYAEAIHSIDKTLSVFRRYYESDRLVINENYPWVVQKYGHWFLEPCDPGADNLGRLLVKRMVRIVARRSLQRAGIFLLKNTDRLSWLFSRPLHQYVLACEAIDAINTSTRTDQYIGTA